MSGDREEVRIIKLKIQIRVSGESEPPEIREKKKRFHHSFIPRSAKYFAALKGGQWARRHKARHVSVQYGMTRAHFNGAHGTVQHTCGWGRAYNFKHAVLKSMVRLEI